MTDIFREVKKTVENCLNMGFHPCDAARHADKVYCLDLVAKQRGIYNDLKSLQTPTDVWEFTVGKRGFNDQPAALIGELTVYTADKFSKCGVNGDPMFFEMLKVFRESMIAEGVNENDE